MAQRKILNTESGDNGAQSLQAQEDNQDRVQIFKHDAVSLKNSKYSSEDYTGILKVIHYKEADKILIEWNIAKISISSHEDEWAMVEKQDKVDDPVRESVSSSAASSSRRHHRHHKIHHSRRQHRHKGSSSSSEHLNDLEKGNPQRPSQAVYIDLYGIKSYRVSKKKNTIELIQRSGSKDLFLFQNGTPDVFIDVLRSLLKTKRAPGRKNLYNVLGRNVGPTFADLNLFENEEQPSTVIWKFISNIHQRPLETTLSSFAKFNDYMLYNKNIEPHRETEVAKVARRLELDEDYTVLVKPIALRPRPPVQRGDPLGHDDWYEVQDSDGRVKDADKIKKIIFRGGVKPSLRMVWKFQLGLYPWDSTRDEREDILKKKSQEYHRMKQQWQSISQDQEDRWTDYSARKSLIEKDVCRTDRELPFFAENSPGSDRNLQTLQDILMTYVMYNFDLGYVQGMSDLLSPLLCTLQDEVETFWCFVSFMERTKHNFDMDQAGMKKQLGQVYQTLSILAPDLSKYLGNVEASNMFFCFRWLLVLFKREFSHDDIMILWEVLWTDLPCPNFHILICAAILDQEKSNIMSNELGFTEILKHVNDLCRKLNLNTILCNAEGIYLQLLEAKETLPTPIKKMFGFVPVDESDSSDCESDIDNTKYDKPSAPPQSEHHATAEPANSTLEDGKSNHKSADYSSDSEDD
uniref:TBC1 domain family member 15 n=1 Tax=Cacopsylla melanoneura TaxID=428564 RepID=A0A8D8Q6R9_9HEMI